MTIQDIINEGVDGQVIPSLTATIDNVYEMKTGTSEHGDWRLQNAILKDATGIIRCTFQNRKGDATPMRGHTFTFKCRKNDKTGLNGIKVKINEYNGKSQKELAITGACDLAPVKEGGDVTSGDSKPSASPSKKEYQAPELAGEVKIKAEFYKNAKLHAYAVAAVMAESEWYQGYTGHPMTPELFQASIASVFIETCKRLPAVSPAIGFPEKKVTEKPKPEPATTDNQEEGDPF